MAKNSIMNDEDLRKIHFFSEFDDDELKKVRSVSNFKTLAKGEMVFFETEPYIGFYIVLKGCIKIFKISKDGREHILHFIYPFDSFAEVPLFEKYEKVSKDEFSYPANAMALENDTKVLLLRSQTFYSLLEKNRSMSLKIISGFAKKLRHLNKHIESLTQDIPKRLARFILEEKKQKFKDGREHFELRMSKHDLASYLGTIDETLSRSLKKFQDDKIITVSGKKITILNKQLLQDSAT